MENANLAGIAGVQLHRRQRWSALVAMLLAALAVPAVAVNKCATADGRVVYQDALCAPATDASRVRLFTPPSDPAGRQRAADEVKAAAGLEKAVNRAPAPAIGFVTVPPGAGPGSLAVLAEACLNVHRVALRDPAHAYWSDPTLDKLDRLRMTLHATNGFGGYVTRGVGCEVRNGQVDASRTALNAGP